MSGNAKKRAQAKRHSSKRSKRRAAKPDRPRLSIDNPPTGYVMSVDDLAEITGSSRNNAYSAIANGVYPSVRQGRTIKVLVLPTLAILRGERPAGLPRTASA